MTKVFFALGVSLLFSGAARADIAVVCRGEIPGVETVELQARLTEDGKKSSSFRFKYLLEPETEDWENPDVDPADTDELYIGHGGRFNYLFAHHNTVIAVSADGDIFGYANAGESAEKFSGYRGKLVLWTGPGDRPHRKVFDIICETHRT